MNKTIDIVLPCYNPEEKTWDVDIKKNIMVLEALFPELTFYVTLINDGSVRNILDENVHILDPFTGTGTFVTRLLQSGLIEEKDLERKYKHEIHANEIVFVKYRQPSV